MHFTAGRVLDGRRNDIQGLRGIAVMAVVLFHVDWPFLGGGYLGVDVFFVISGFLITHILVFDVGGGEYSLGQFYLRRVRRLLPASVVTIGATLLVGALLFATHDLAALGLSAAYAMLSVSNILFWMQSGYFDDASHLKPLLHMWSLGVEEQFFLVWPAFLLLLARFRNPVVLVASIGIAGAASLLCAILYLDTDPSAVFFLMPFRIFEFSAGALLCFLPRVRSAAVKDVFHLLGLGLIAASVVWLDSSYAMPGVYSLVPVAGAVLCIAGGTGRVSSVVRAAPLRRLGDISYSLYLVHWPLIVFYKYAAGTDLSPGEQIALVAVSIALGYALHIAVETPMRRESFWSGRSRLSPILPALLVLALVFGTSLNLWTSSGWQWRSSPEIRTAVARTEGEKDRRLTFINAIRDEARPDQSGGEIVIIGDSHGSDILMGLYQQGVTNLRKISTSSPCQPVMGGPDEDREDGKPYSVEDDDSECAQKFRAILDDPSIRTARTIVIAPRWRKWAASRVSVTIDALRKRSSATIVVFGPSVEWEPSVPRIVEAWGRRAGVDRHARDLEKPLPRSLNKLLGESVERSGAIYVDKIALLCGDADCPLFLPDGDNLWSFDYGHMTIESSRYFMWLVRERHATAARHLFAPERDTAPSGPARQELSRRLVPPVPM